jgi:ABC-2 type transport system ATP-binding protein
MTSHYAIEMRRLTKRYAKNSTPALKELSLTVERGEIFGYLGPNGAGKTTTIRLLLDFIRPTSGSIDILGLNPQSESRAIRSQIGNLPGELQLWEHLTGRQILRYLADLRPGCEARYAFKLAERLNLDLNVKAASYSTGNRRKVGIIQAMMHRPALLILDEPTNGLDPLVRQEFNALLREIRDDGRTVFLSSHVLSEAQAVCDRVGILRAGELQTVVGVKELQATIERHVTIFSHDPLLASGWDDMASVTHVESGVGFIRLSVAGSLDAVVKRAANYVVDDLRVETAGLEDVFMEVYSNHD